MKTLLFVVLLLGISRLVNAEKPAVADRLPNIVFIMADDLGMQDVGFMGSRYFETPHLDALAEQSVVFNQAYMYPTCSPSRAALLTGQQSFRTGIYNVPVLERGSPKDNIFSRWTVTREHPVYAEPLGQAGYALIHLGKWHIVGPHPDQEVEFPLQKPLGQPRNGDLSWLPAHRETAIAQLYPTGRGFHENVGGTWWGDPARGYAKGYRAEGGGFVAPFKNPFIDEKAEGGWLTDRLTSDAIAFIDRHQDVPFFVNLHFYAPHRPTIPRNPALLDYFLNKEGDAETGQGMPPTKEGGKTPRKKEMAAYATMVKSIDDNVKRVLDALDQKGLRENTVVIFTSDNGFNGLQSRNDRLRGAKGNVYEGGLRVPMLVSWPGELAAARRDEPVQGLDWFPTFLELAGINDHPGILDGESLMPLLREQSWSERPLFWHLASTYKDSPCSIIRRGDWKLIQSLRDGTIELYNLTDDLRESIDLAASQPEIARQLLSELVDWRRMNNVPLPPSSTLPH